MNAWTRPIRLVDEPAPEPTIPADVLDAALDAALTAYDNETYDGSQRSEDGIRAGLVAAWPHLTGEIGRKAEERIEALATGLEAAVLALAAAVDDRRDELAGDERVADHDAAELDEVDDPAPGIGEDHLVLMPDDDVTALASMYGLQDLVETVATQMDLDDPWTDWRDWRAQPIRLALVAARNRGWDEAALPRSTTTDEESHPVTETPTIPEETLWAAVAAYDGVMDDGSGLSTEALRAVLAAAYPHVVAPLHAEIAELRRTIRAWQAAREQDLTDEAPCPTCSGPTRETVGMVRQTCGTDYGPDAAGPGSAQRAQEETDRG